MKKETARNQEMVELRNNDWTLQEISDRYNISRERVRQIIGNTGFTATPTKTKKNLSIYQENKHKSNSFILRLMGLTKASIQSFRRTEKVRHEIDSGHAKIGYETENIVSQKLLSLGVKNTLMLNEHRFDILLENGMKVDVKSSNPLSVSVNTPSYSFNTKKYYKGDYCDFFILYLRDVKEFFVVPNKVVGGIIRFSWPEPDKGKKSKWHKYHNRFDFLKG